MSCAATARDFEQDLRMLYLEAHGRVGESTQVFAVHKPRIEGGDGL